MTRLTDGQRAAAIMAVLGMAAAALYGLVISYHTVRILAVELAMPLPAVFPLGIEGGLVAVLAMDLVLTWVRRPIAWLRQFARMLSAAAIGINAAAGLPMGPLAVVMHALAPIVLIAGVEALRHHLLRLVADADQMRREPIPRMRWLLAPVSTVAMWRRMVLWQITSYNDALDADLDRREITHALRREFGRGWRREIPADVAYRLTTGVRLGEAIERARELIAARHVEVVEDDPAGLSALESSAPVVLVPTMPIPPVPGVPDAVPDGADTPASDPWEVVDDPGAEAFYARLDAPRAPASTRLVQPGAGLGTTPAATRHTDVVTEALGLAPMTHEEGRTRVRADLAANLPVSGTQLAARHNHMSERWWRQRLAEVRADG